MKPIGQIVFLKNTSNVGSSVRVTGNRYLSHIQLSAALSVNGVSAGKHDTCVRLSGAASPTTPLALDPVLAILTFCWADTATPSTSQGLNQCIVVPIGMVIPNNAELWLTDTGNTVINMTSCALLFFAL